MLITNLALLVISAALAHDARQPIEVERYQLANGIRVILAYVPEAQRQATFTLLPLHMGNDGPGRAQWSHLLEHHLLRSTDPEALAVPGIDINGETMHHSARLDTLALPEHWPAAIERHGNWLTARTFDAQVHARELEMIHGEERATAMTGWTHKFALAAWNQIVRHGRHHARVHGDVADSAVDDVMQYATDHLPIDESVWIATVGPIDPDQVKEAIAAHIGSIEPQARALPAMSRQGELPIDATGTWDLPIRHLIMWWQLPARDPGTIATAQVVGDALQMQLAQSDAVAKSTRTLLVQSVVPAPEATYFIINCTIGPDTDHRLAAAAIEAVLAGVADSPTTVLLARQMPMRFLNPQVLRMHRRQAPAEFAFAVEANWMVQGVLVEYSAGCSREELDAAWAAMTQEGIAAFLAALHESSHGTLMLEPE